MNSGDLYKVWEIKVFKSKPKAEDARKFLERIAEQVEPIMRKHKWRIKLLSEFCQKQCIGLNIGAGTNVKLRLRSYDSDEEFLPFHEVLDTMLHELCHNAIAPHNDSFYKLWDELREVKDFRTWFYARVTVPYVRREDLIMECGDLINKEISGSGQGLDLPGSGFGEAYWDPLHYLEAALAAAENRAGRIGGDSSIMVALSPVQAAAMAAERRVQDNIWCGSDFVDLTGEDDRADSSLPKSSEKGCCYEISKTAFDEHVMTVKSRKRSRGSDDVPQGSTFIDLTETVSQIVSSCYLYETSPTKNCRVDLYREASTSSSISSHVPMHNNDRGTWRCTACTFLNLPSAPMCGLCVTRKPEVHNVKT